MRKFVCSLFCLALCSCLLFSAAGETEIILTFGGDAVLGTREEWKKKADTFDTCIAKNGFAWPFAGLAEVFQADDLTQVNLECVLQKTSRGIVKNKEYRFRGDPSYTEILAVAGIESVNIANNHYIDYSASGRKSTREALRDGGIAFSGYEFLYVYEQDGYKIGFGGCRETVFRRNKKIAQNDIKKLKQMGCDVIIYACHWGEEYSPTHNSRQESMAAFIVDCGADLIIGTHPHCVQGIEAISGVPVLYSLGNLMFGGTHEMRTFDAYLARVILRFGEDGYEGVEIQPIPILTSGAIPANNFQPVLAEGKDFQRIVELIQNDSTKLITESMWFPRSKR